jgi:hypothetical protein
MSKLPSHTSRADFDAAIHRFDAEFRGLPAWASWSSRANQWSPPQTVRLQPVRAEWVLGRLQSRQMASDEVKCYQIAQMFRWSR